MEMEAILADKEKMRGPAGPVGPQGETGPQGYYAVFFFTLISFNKFRPLALAR